MPWRFGEQGRTDAAAFEAVFLLTIRDLLRQEGAGLARCQFHQCDNFFVRDDPRQLYCSEAHAHRAHQYRYRTGRTIGEVKGD